MPKLKKFVLDHKPEIAIGVGVVTACVAAYLYHRDAMQGKEIHIIEAYRNNKNDDIKLLIQYYNKKQEIVDIVRPENRS